jgi:hypothetical protein
LSRLSRQGGDFDFLKTIDPLERTMKLRSLILATIVLLALVGTLYWSNHRKPEDTTLKPTESSPAILKLDESSIEQVEIKRPDNEPIVLTKTNSGAWQITKPQVFSADQANVSSTLSSLAALNSQRVVEDKATDLKQYGLEPPAVEVDVTEKGNKSQKLLLGDSTPSGAGVYAMLSGDPRVFTIASYNKTSIAKTLNDFRDKRLLPVSADQVSRLDIVHKNQTMEFGRTKDGWQILQPKPMRADSVQVGDLVQKLTDARMDLNGTDPKGSSPAFAAASPVATAKITAPSGAQELQIKKNKDTYYAKSSAVDGIYKVNADLGQALAKGIDDFRSKKLFDFGFTDPTKIEIHSGPKAYFLTRSGQDWWSNGKKMEVDTVAPLISDIRDLVADKFADAGFANPTIDIAVTGEDGKSTEKVSIANSTDGYLAQRQNDPTTYHLTASSVDDLLKAADNIKPATTPAK